MPFSHSSQISVILDFIETLRPQSVLDVGTGTGQYGFLVRNHLEYTNLFRVEGNRGWQTPREDWQIRIDGIEGCETYMTPVHGYAYNQVLIGDALKLLPTLATHGYDLVMAIDILEHFDPEDGLRFMDELKRISSRAALVSTPKSFYPQEIEANPYENHRSLWSASQLSAQGFDTLLPNVHSWIAAYQSPAAAV